VPDKAFEALVRQAFSQRRKTLRNALKGACQAEVIAQAGIDPDARPQTLAVQDFARLVSQQLADSGG
jgi:16S rRNA (adenine1518-N6/adenine1519-N6)-dimethyltransferase